MITKNSKLFYFLIGIIQAAAFVIVSMNLMRPMTQNKYIQFPVFLDNGKFFTTASLITLIIFLILLWLDKKGLKIGRKFLVFILGSVIGHIVLLYIGLYNFWANFRIM